MPDAAAIAVVGAGVAGLAAAQAIARAGRRAVVVDRVPVPGGVLGDRHPDVRRLVDGLDGRVELVLGATATRWVDGELLVLAPGRVRRVAASALVVAPGTRPCGRAELGLGGERPAGVLPAPAACHLLETGLLLGRRPLVIGTGDWAERAIHHLAHAGAAAVTVVCADAARPRSLPDVGARIVLLDLRPLALRGRGRVEALVCRAASGEEVVVDCDAVVLAAGVVALRNVDGALDDAPDVHHVALPQTVALAAEAIAAGERAAAGALAT